MKLGSHDAWKTCCKTNGQCGSSRTATPSAGTGKCQRVHWKLARLAWRPGCGGRCTSGSQTNFGYGDKGCGGRYAGGRGDSGCPGGEGRRGSHQGCCGSGDG